MKELLMAALQLLPIKAYFLSIQKEKINQKCHRYGHREKQNQIQFGFQQLMLQIQKRQKKF